MGISQRGLKAYVFREADDKPRVQYYRIAGKFKEAVQRAGLGRNVTLQDCRRTVGSLLAEQGVNQRVAAEFLGHTDIATTAKYYQAVRPETLKGVAVKLRTTGAKGGESLH